MTDKINFSCDKCGAKYYGRANMIGQNAKCAKCREIFIIKKQEIVDSGSSDDVYSTNSNKPLIDSAFKSSKTSKTEQATQTTIVAFECPTCKSKLDAKEMQAGEEINCPNCNEIVMVPESAKAAMVDDQCNVNKTTHQIDNVKEVGNCQEPAKRYPSIEKYKEEKRRRELLAAADMGMSIENYKLEMRHRNNEESDLIKCSRCGSRQITCNTKGFSGLKAVGGAVIAGPIGLLAGLHNSKKLIITCLKCGYSWEAKGSK